MKKNIKRQVPVILHNALVWDGHIECPPCQRLRY